MPLKITRSISLISFLVFFIISVLNILSPDVAKAQTLFFDNFDHDLSLWETHSTTGEWNIIEEELVGTAVNSLQPTQPSYALAGNPKWENYSLYVKIKGNVRPDKQIIFRVNNDGNYYVLNIVGTYDGSGNKVILTKKYTSDFTINVVDLSFLHIYPYINSPEEWYSVNIDVKNIANSVNIKIYINDTFILEANDSNNPILEGKIGFEVWPGEYYHSPSPTINYFDNVLVTEYGYGLALDLPVENLKQYNLNWGNEIYNNALKWAQVPTIENWGCALTSVSMVLRYHGYDVWPNTLNDWLKNQPDGFIRGGLVNWLAVSKYTQKYTDINSPILKFRRYHVNPITLEEELLQGRPPILELPGHFIVAKGRKDSDFLINDPASETSLLSVLENTRGMYTSINSYIPTSTDLSYIMLIINEDSQVSLFDAAGNPVSTSSYVQEPLQNSLDKSQKSGEKLRILLLPEPQSGTYSVVIKEGDGPFQLDAYMYDQEGNLIDNEYITITGIVSGESSIHFQFIYDKSSITYSLVDYLSAQVTSVNTNKSYYKKGDVLEIEVNVTNNGSLTFDPTKEKLTINIEGPNGLINGSFREQQGVDLAPGELGTYIFYMSPQSIPENWSEGNYTVYTTIYSSRTSPLNYLPGGQSSHTQFTIDNIKPVITWNNPHNNELQNTSLELNVNCDGTHGLCDYVNYWWFETEQKADNSTKRYHQLWEDGNLFTWILNSLAPDLADGGVGDKLEGNYILRAAAKDKAGNYNHSDIQVVFDNTPPSSSFSSPLDREIFGGPKEKVIYIDGHSTDESTNTVVSVSLFNRTSGKTFEKWQLLAKLENVASNELFNWNMEWAPKKDGVYDFKAIATDNAGNIEETAYAYEVIYDTTTPTLEWVNPAEYAVISGTTVVSSNATDATSGVESVKYEYQKDDGVDSWHQIAILTNSPYETSWNTTGLALGDYTLKAVATDNAGNSIVIERSVGVTAVISNESWSRPGWGEITITWTTDRPTDGRVVYDTVSHAIDLSHLNYGYAHSSGTVDTSPKTLSHTITLSGLSNSTTYYWRTVSGGSPKVIGSESRGDTFSIPGGDTGGEGVVAGVTTSVTTTPFPYAELEETSISGDDSEEVLGEETEIVVEEPETPLDETVDILSKTAKGRILAISAFLLGLILYFISRRRKK